MSAYTDGLRELATFLDDNPDFPEMVSPRILAPQIGEDRVAAVLAAAESLGVDVITSDYGIDVHHVAERMFGPIEFRVAAITRQPGAVSS